MHRILLRSIERWGIGMWYKLSDRLSIFFTDNVALKYHPSAPGIRSLADIHIYKLTVELGRIPCRLKS